MESLPREFLLLMLGCLAALSGLQSVGEIRKKSWILQALFVVGLLTQFATQGLQYSNAVGDRTARERNQAFALFAYTARDVELLNYYSKDNPYIVGYRLFKDGKSDKARPFFHKSIEKNIFVSPSHYMLAHIILTQDKDQTEARKHLDLAIKNDPKYPAAYYARAKMKYRAKELTAALADLKEAAEYGLLSCLDLNREEEVMGVWPDLANDQRFKELAVKCRHVHEFERRETEPSLQIPHL